jgi:hypothetical protein
MSGRFSDLKPGSDSRKEFWNANEFLIRLLLEEINRDVFDSKGEFRFARHVIHSARNSVNEPNLYLETNRGSITVCTASTETLRVVVERYTYCNGYDIGISATGRWWITEPYQLEEILVLGIQYMLG